MAISESQRKAVAKYNAANYDRIELRIEKGLKQGLKEHAESRGETLNGFVNRAIKETLDRDNAATEWLTIIAHILHIFTYFCIDKSEQIAYTKCAEKSTRLVERKSKIKNVRWVDLHIERVEGKQNNARREERSCSKRGRFPFVWGVETW